MRKSREWLGIAMRGGRLAEVAAVSDPLDAATVRRTRRLVRRGQVAEDPASARLAVALAREQQRRFSAQGLVVVALLAAGAAVFAGIRLEHGGVSVVVLLAAAFAIWFAWGCWETWHLDATAQRAELANMRLLEDAGERYPRRPPSGLITLSGRVEVLAALVVWLLYDLSYGALTLVMDERALSLGRIVGRGVLWATLMVFVNVVFLRGQTERRSEKSTVGQRGTWA